MARCRYCERLSMECVCSDGYPVDEVEDPHLTYLDVS